MKDNTLNIYTIILQGHHISAPNTAQIVQAWIIHQCDSWVEAVSYTYMDDNLYGAITIQGLKHFYIFISPYLLYSKL